MEKQVLYALDKKGKVRVTSVELNSIGDIYELSGESGLLDGKKTPAITEIIDKGKAKRTVEQQALLQYNAKVKKYKDKGMKSLDDLPENINNLKLEAFLLKHLDSHKTDANGVKKCMRATNYKDIKNYEKVIKDNKWLISRKLDGTRCQLLINNGAITSASRGGGDYNPAIKHIIEHPEIIRFFNNHPDVILDGELYIHGMHLQELSGIARLKDSKKISDRPKLHYHIYELMNDKTAKERYDEILELSKEFTKCEYLHIVDQYEINSFDEAIKKHDEFVSEGYEGAVMKTFSNLYIPGKSSTMLKIKEMEDAEFEILGIVEKKRPEDFVFLMKTGDKTTEAKPSGTIEERLELKSNINELIGKFATIQFFGWTPDGCLNLPVFKCVRDFE